MKVTQIKDLVNSSLKELNGSSVLLKEDLSNVVDVGTEIFDTDNVDNFVKKLSKMAMCVFRLTSIFGYDE